MMLLHQPIWYSLQLGLGVALTCASVTSCSQAIHGGPRPGGASPQESPGLFAAAVQYFATRSDYPTRVDPRPLRPEARLHSVTDLDILLDGTAEIVRMRTTVLDSANWGLANAVADWTCVFAEAAPRARPPTDTAQTPQQVRHEACRRSGRFQSLIFGIPQRGVDPAHPDRWRIRSMRMFLHGYEGIDLFLERSASGRWMVVEAKDLTGVFS